MRNLRVVLLVLVLPLFAYGAGSPPVIVGEIWRSKDSARVLCVLSKTRVELRDHDVSAVAPMAIDGKKVTVTTTLFGHEIRLVFRRVERALVGPDNVALYPSAELTARERIDRSKRALAMIGKHLKALEEAGKLRSYSGAAFLLQVRDRLSDDELSCFRGAPDDGTWAFRDSPEPGTPEYVTGIRKVDLVKGVEDWHSAYAGPNWRQYPAHRAGEGKRRLWACDRCYMAIPPHDGVVVLWNDLTVEFLPIATIRGADVKAGFVPVGPNSPDPRLQKMCYLSPR